MSTTATDGLLAALAGLSKEDAARRGVQHTRDFDRIRNLPRRRWQEDPDLERLTDLLTAHLKQPAGRMRLRPIQAQALREIHDVGGLFGSIVVGGGKTLITLLAPTVVGARRPLLLLPAKLRGKTKREAAELAHSWRLPPFLKIVSYDSLGRLSHEHFLDQYKPDLIIADECHRLKNLSASGPKRVKRYMLENQQTRFVAVSGTITRKSIRDYWHLLLWAIRGLAPVPRSWPEMMEWAAALDAKVREGDRMAPGVLLQLCEPGDEGDPRIGYRRRLVETPGVIASSTIDVGASINIRGIRSALSDQTKEYFREMRETWKTPDGHPFEQASELWRHARELACGFYYRWNPRPPDEWLEARLAWHQYLRDVLKHNRQRLDSPEAIVRAIKHGNLRDTEGVYREWCRVRHLFDPRASQEAVWTDSATVKLARDWLRKHPKDGIVWVEHTEFGKGLEHVTGVPFFGAGGFDRKGRYIEDWNGSVIASVNANCEGRNLQFKWCRNFVVSCTPSGGTYEQLIGRTHRQGQEADEIDVEQVFGCAEQVAGFWKAVVEAEYTERTLQQPQKLLYADKDVLTLDDVADLADGGCPLWKQIKH